MRALKGTLTGDHSPSDFSQASLAKLSDLRSDYIEEVGLAAILQARRNGSDVVSLVDIEHGDRIVRSSNRKTRWTEAIGGILAGAGTGTFIQLAVEKHPSILGMAISGLIAAVGLVTTTAAYFGREH